MVDYVEVDEVVKKVVVEKKVVGVTKIWVVVRKVCCNMVQSIMVFSILL